MGCFARTCGLTRTGINEGDKVLLIELNDNELSGYYDFIQTIQRRESRIEELNNYSEGLRKILSENKTTCLLPSPIKGAHIGTYNDYGGIEEVELEELRYESIEHFIFHYWAVKTVMGEVKTDKEFINKFLKKLYFLRTSPIDTTLMGQQHPDIDECKEQLKLNLATNRFLRKKIKDFKNNNY